MTIAKRVSQSIVIRENDLHLGIVLYLVVGMLVIVVCAFFGWLGYDLIHPTDAAALSDGTVPTEIDALYFSTATFTTLGYGDFVPAGAAGRCLAMFEAFIGTAHSVFFVLLFLKGGVVTSVKLPEVTGTDTAC